VGELYPLPFSNFHTFSSPVSPSPAAKQRSENQLGDLGSSVFPPVGSGAKPRLHTHFGVKKEGKGSGLERSPTFDNLLFRQFTTSCSNPHGWHLSIRITQAFSLARLGPRPYMPGMGVVDAVENYYFTTQYLLTVCKYGDGKYVGGAKMGRWRIAWARSTLKTCIFPKWVIIPNLVALRQII